MGIDPLNNVLLQHLEPDKNGAPKATPAPLHRDREAHGKDFGCKPIQSGEICATTQAATASSATAAGKSTGTWLTPCK